jgi:hypothetical protein
MRNYVSIAVFGLAFGFATAVTLLLFASAASTLRGTTAATSAIHVASTPPDDGHVMVINDDPWGWTDQSSWHHHWHGRMGSLEARIRERVARKIEAAFAHMSDDFDIDIDVDNDDDNEPPTPPAAVVPTTPVITTQTH